MAQTAPSSGFGPVQFLLSLAGVSAILLAGLLTISQSYKGIAVGVGGVATVTYILCWGNVREASLVGFFAMLPVMIGKALIHGSPTLAPPGFYFTAPDVFMVPLAVACLLEHRGQPTLKAGRGPLRLGLVFVAWVLLTTLIMAPQNLFVAILTYGRYVTAGFAVAYGVRSSRDLRLVMYGLALGLLLQTAVALAQFAAHSSLHIPGLLQGHVGVNLALPDTDAFRPSGLAGHPLALGDFLLYLLPTLGLLFVSGPSRIGRLRWWCNGLLSLLAIAVLVVTLARSAWLASLVAAVYLLVLAMRIRLLLLRHLAAVLGLIALLLLALLIVYPDFYLRLTSADASATLTRWLMWEQAAKIIYYYPVFGVGYAEYNDTAQIIQPADFGHYSTAYIDQVTAGVVHNKYLLVGAEHGIPGLLLFVALVISGIIRLFPLRQWRDTMLVVIAIGVSASMLAQCIYYFFDHVFSDMRITLLWSFLGLIAALRTINAQFPPRDAAGTRLATVV